MDPSSIFSCLGVTSEIRNLLLQWAEVLSADAFSAFEDAGLEDTKVCIHNSGPFKSLETDA